MTGSPLAPALLLHLSALLLLVVASAEALPGAVGSRMAAWRWVALFAAAGLVAELLHVQAAPGSWSEIASHGTAVLACTALVAFGRTVASDRDALAGPQTLAGAWWWVPPAVALLATLGAPRFAGGELVERVLHVAVAGQASLAAWWTVRRLALGVPRLGSLAGALLAVQVLVLLDLVPRGGRHVLGTLTAGGAAAALFGSALVRRRAEVAVLTSRQSGLLTALEDVGVAVAVSGLDARITHVNRAFVELWELADASEALGRHPGEFFADPAVVVPVLAAMQADGRWTGELTARTARGAVRPLEVSALLLRGPDGEPAGFQGTFVPAGSRRPGAPALVLERVLSTSLLNAAPTLVVVLTPDGRIDAVNALFERRTGFTQAELAGRDWVETMIPARERERIRALFSTAVTGTQTRGNRNAIVTKDGTELEIEWYDSILPGAEGTPWRLLAIGLDVSARARLERQLEASEWRYRTIVEAAPECVKVVAADGELLQMNAAGLAMLEVDSVEAVNRRGFETFIAAEDRSVARAALERCLRGESSTAEFWVEGARGTRRWVEQRGTPLRDPEDATRIVGMLAVTRDRTASWEAEQALRASEARLLEAQRIGRLGSWDLDLGTGALRWSPEIFAIFELDPREFSATYAAFLAQVHPEDRETLDAIFQRSVRDRTPYRFTHRLAMPDGRVKWVEERGLTEYGADGLPVRSAGTVQDITDRVLAEQEVRRSLAEKETLLREIHHRVKNNLQVVSSLLYFQSKRFRDAQDVELLREGQQRIQAMVLLHECLYGGQDLAQVDLRRYFDALLPQLAVGHGLGPRGIRLTSRVPDGVSLPLETAMPVALLVAELVANSAKHGFPDRGGTIAVTLDAGPEVLRLSVRDDGVGLRDGVLPEGASSFGLHLVRTLAAQVDGQLTVEPGPGTAITLSFPRRGARTAA